jgi:uncharacterized membrane protein YkgB
MRDPGGPATDAVQMLPPSATRALRIAFGILFLWLGLLKIVPGVSPAEDLMRASMPSFVPIDLFIRFAAVWEIVIGIGFLTARYRRLVVLMTFATMAVTLSILWMAPGRVWTGFPFGLSFEGEYVIKDVVIAAAAILLAVATVQERPALGAFGEALRRRWPQAIERYLAFEVRVEQAIAPLTIPLLRGALGLVFIWFGLINAIDPLGSPTWPIIEASTLDEAGPAVFRIWGVVGVLTGIGILVPRLERLAVVLLVGMAGLTLTLFVTVPDVLFQHPPLVLTLEGQHVVKNLILAAAAIAVVRARPQQTIEPMPEPPPVATAEGGANLVG